MANYIKLTWTNTCDLGRTLYNGINFEQVMFLDADVIKPDYIDEETGFENGEGEFVKTAEKKKKRYKFELMAPEYVVDALKAMSVCDTINLLFVNGLYSTEIRNLRVDASWDDDFNGCMALVTVSFEQNDQLVKTSCCDNMT
jgi:hypothetical protein